MEMEMEIWRRDGECAGDFYFNRGRAWAGRSGRGQKPNNNSRETFPEAEPVRG